MKKTIVFLLAVAFVFASCKSADSASTADSKTPKLCALTFDDGPNVDKTPLVLEKLAKHKIVATFFLVGQLVNDETKPVLDRAAALGCEFGNHSWGWASMNQMSTEEIKESVSMTAAAIKKYTGQTPRFFRPPNLATSDEMYDAIGLPFAEGVLGMDWAGCNTSAKDRANNVLSGMKDGAIILLHDVQPEPHPTPDALDILIPALKKQGYEFVTVSELFRRKGIDPAGRQYQMWKYVE